MSALYAVLIKTLYCLDRDHIDLLIYLILMRNRVVAKTNFFVKGLTSYHKLPFVLVVIYLHLGMTK